MDKKLDTLYDLCDVVYKELEIARDKIHDTHDGISASDTEFLDKLTHIYKSLQTSIAMLEADDRHSGNYYRGGSYARRGRSMGRYTRDDAHDDFMHEIEEAIEKAPDEHTRRKLEHMLAEMK